jgi:hypothetical protein
MRKRMADRYLGVCRIATTGSSLNETHTACLALHLMAVLGDSIGRTVHMYSLSIASFAKERSLLIAQMNSSGSREVGLARKIYQRISTIRCGVVGLRKRAVV